MVDNEQYWKLDNGGQWTMLENGHLLTLDNGGQWTMAQHVTNGTNWSQ